MTSPSVKLLRTQTDERLVALAAAGAERARLPIERMVAIG